MAHAALVVLGWLLLLSSAGATISPTPTWGVGGAPWFTTKAAACDAYADTLGPPPPLRCVQPGAEAYCTHAPSGTCPYYSYSTLIGGPGTCPTNSTLTGGNCVCNSMFVESGGACVTTCTAGTTKRGHIPAGSAPGVVCFDGCQAEVQNANNQWSVGGAPVIAGTWISMAAACSGQPTGNASTTPTQAACPPGQGLGTIGGVSACYPSSPTVPAVSTSVKTVTNPDNTSTTTTTTTTNVGGNTTTNVTSVTKDASGTPTGTTTTADSKPLDGKENPVKEFCELYPNSPMCKSGAWSGTCAAFTCDGDAVQCAQAQATWALACEAVKDSDQKTLGQAIVAGSDPAAATLPNPAAPTVVAMGTLSSTGWLGRTCPGNQTFSIWGGASVTLPFLSLCSYLEAFGLIIMVVAGVASARIVGVI